jgi:hypothetical protein
MDGTGQGMVALLGVAADRRLLDEDLDALPVAEQRREPAISTHRHDRLVALGSLLTGVTLVAGTVLALFAGWRLLFHSGGAADALLCAIGVVLAGTHWGWVHVAEYVGVTIDDRNERAVKHRGDQWLETIEPYPRFSVSTGVLDDASTVVERTLHRPVLTPAHTFTFVREVVSRQEFPAGTPAAELASAVETTRREARLETDRQRELWEAASTAYRAELHGAHDDAERLAAERAAAQALSEHINASLLEPPLVE